MAGGSGPQVAVAGSDHLDGVALALAHADALGHEDRLAVRMGVPCRAGAGREVHQRGGTLLGLDAASGDPHVSSLSGSWPQQHLDRVALVHRAVAVVEHGSAAERACPADETSCTGTFKLTLTGKRKKRVGSGRFSTPGGKSALVRPKLSRAARATLKKKGKLKVRVTVTASDAAGNRAPTRKTLKLTPKRVT
jgi:hypothetical protein